MITKEGLERKRHRASVDVANIYLNAKKKKFRKKERRKVVANQKLDTSIAVVKAYMKFRKPIETPVLTRMNSRDKAVDALRRAKIKQHEVFPVRKTIAKVKTSSPVARAKHVLKTVKEKHGVKDERESSPGSAFTFYGY